MLSLRQLIADKSPLLLVDSTSARIQTALIPNDKLPPRWHSSENEAGTAIFETAAAALADTPVTELRAIIYCEGPGSTLGIRTAAAACRAWRIVNPRIEIYSYKSLELIAAALNRPDTAIICDARRDSWHFSQLNERLRRIPADKLPQQAAAELLTPEHFARWQTLPPGTATTPYDLPCLWQAANDAPLLALSENPDAFLHEVPAYVTWNKQIHQAPK